MANKSLTLILDQGSHASRAIVFNAQGEKITEASMAVETLRQGDRVELDAIALVDSLKKVALDAYDQLGAEQGHLKTAGLATQRSNIVCWRKSDYTALSPILSWQDRRAEDKLKNADFTYIQSKTGLFANAHYGASKMAWCLEHISEVNTAAELHDLGIGPMASYLASRLPNSTALADPANASRTLLWNIHTRNWDEELCRFFGIDKSILPPCVTSDYGFGFLSLRDRQIPLRIVSGDLSAAAFLNGLPQKDTAYITLGTGAFVQRIIDEPGLHAPLLDGVLWSSADRQLFSLEGTVNGAGSAISWLAEQHGIAEETIFQHVEQWLADIQNPPLFLNAVSGIGSPLWCAHETPGFDRDASLPEQVTAVLESILFLLILNMQVMHESLPRAQCINISGGLSSIKGFCRKLADLSGLPVQCNLETEGTALGLAYLLTGFPTTWPAKFIVFEPALNTGLSKRYAEWMLFVRDSVSEYCRYFKSSDRDMAHQMQPRPEYQYPV